MASTGKSDFVDALELPPEHVFFGLTPAMAMARDKLEKIAGTSVPVLVQGESGTGKDIFARMLHARSKRSRHALVKVTCPAIPHSLIESELFGYEKGAFTGAYSTKRGRVELAHMGSLFLDEVGSLGNAAQAKLLQVLQDGAFMRVGAQESRSVDMRLICVANGNLREQAEDGACRLDFFFRISAVTIDLPPLRQRVEDLPVLIDYFLDRNTQTYRKEPKPLSRHVVSLMERYKWPGNIRQLENLIRAYVLLDNEDALIAELLPSTHAGTLPEIDLDNPVSLKRITKAATRDLERQIILKVLKANEWSRQKTARWLNMSYRSLLYKLRDSDLSALKSRKRNRQLTNGALNSDNVTEPWVND
jgi:two-component system, NtrC family, response regulator AtoC